MYIWLDMDNAIVYDIEVYSGFFLVGAYSKLAKAYRQFIVCEKYNIDDRESLFKIFRNRVVVGFNNNNYDDKVLGWFFKNPTASTFDIKVISDYCIQNNFNFRPNFYKYSYDLMELHRVGYNVPSLKKSGVILKLQSIQVADVDFNKSDLTFDDIEKIKKYNINDVFTTLSILDHPSTQKELMSREFLYNYYDKKVPALLTASKSKASKLIFTYLYRDKLNKPISYDRVVPRIIKLKDLIYPFISFETDIARDYLEKLKSLEIADNDKFEPIVLFNKEYTIARGGIHSVDSPLYLEASENNLIIDIDVASMYPMSIINNSIVPRDIDPCILDILKELTDTRLASKKILSTLSSDHPDYKFHKSIASDFKIMINSFFGILGDSSFWLYDLEALYKVTINNQLMELMLIERFGLAGIEVISANTDGITIYIEKSRLEECRRIYKEWERLTKFTLEETSYKKYIRRDVNNYIAIKDDGEVKAKGIFSTELDFTKGFKFPIISIGLVNYYVKGISPEETVNTHEDLHDFFYSEKTSSDFEVFLCKVKQIVCLKSEKTGKVYKNPKVDEVILEMKPIPSIYRVIVVKPDIVEGDICYGTVIKKRKNVKDKLDSIAGLKNCFVKLMNEFEEIDRNLIDKKFYINLIYEEIAKIIDLRQTYNYIQKPNVVTQDYLSSLQQEINRLRSKSCLDRDEIRYLSLMLLNYLECSNLCLTY